MKTPHTAVAIQWVGYLWTAPRIFPKENKVLLGVGLPLFLRALTSLCAPRTGGFDDDARGKATGLMGSPLLVHTQPSRPISPTPGRKRLTPGTQQQQVGLLCGTATPETTSWLSPSATCTVGVSVGEG